MGYVGDDINIKSSLNILKFVSNILFFRNINPALAQPTIPYSELSRNEKNKKIQKAAIILAHKLNI
jgi:hypothetical protein